MKHLALFVALAVTCVVSGSAYGQGADDCATAQVINIAAGGQAQFDAAILDPNTEDPEPFNPACGAGSGDMLNDVWFSFEAPADGVMSFSTCGGVPNPVIDTDMAIYQGTPAECGTGQLVEIDCNDDACAGFGSIVFAMPVTATTNYLIRLGGWDAAAVGTATLDVTHFGSLPATNVTCTDNGDSNNPLVDVTFDLDPPVNGASYDSVNVYVDGVLTTTIPGPLTAGPQTVTGLSIPTGQASQICVETVTSGFVSPQVCCNAFISAPCPPSANVPMSPTAFVQPIVGNIACGTAANTATNSYFRAYDFINQYGVSDDITLTCFGSLLDAVQSPNGSVAVRIRLHYDLTGGAPNDTANFVLFYEEEFEVPNLADEFFNFVFGTGIVDPDLLGLATTPSVGCLSAQSAGATLVVEMQNLDDAAVDELFFTSSSDASAAVGNPVIDETYIFAPACNLNTPTPFAQIGFPNTLIPMDLTYDVAAAGVCTGGGGVANLACQQVVGDTTVDLTWTAAGGAASFTVEVDGNLEGTVGGLVTVFTTLPMTAYTATPVTVTAWTGAGGTGTVINSRSCTVNVAPANNWLSGAEVLNVGTVPLQITTDVNVQGPALDILVCDMDPLGALGGDTQLWNDLYYTYTAGVTGEVLVSTCSGVTGDSRIAIYNGVSNAAADTIACNDDRIIGYVSTTGTNPNVNNPACTNFASELTFDATAGTTYTVRVGTFNAAGIVPNGELTINDCVPVGNLAYTMDCNTGDVTLTWDDNPAATSISILRDGVSIATPTLGTTTFTDLAVADGDHVYEVVIDCGSGPNSASINASVLTYTNYTDLVFGMEGLQSNPEGLVGDIDSAPAILSALLNNSRNAAMVRYPFIDYPCLTDVENLWIALGSNTDSLIFGAGILGPDVVTVGNAYLLNSAENDYLGTQGAAGINIYLEGADHWAFDHQPGIFDTRDGIDDTTLAGPGFIAAFDGDDSLTVIDGDNSGFGVDLSSLVDVLYTQDDAVEDDFTDQLTVATGANADAFGPDAAAIARLDDLTATGLAIAQYDVMVHYDTNSGGKTVSSSFEFGGFGDAPTRDTLAAQILAGFPGGPTGDPEFRRGGINNDGLVNIADAVYLLGALFPVAPNPPNMIDCEKSGDVNDDGGINIADAVALLGGLFSGQTVPAPFATCGTDPTPDSLTCTSSPTCP